MKKCWLACLTLVDPRLPLKSQQAATEPSGVLDGIRFDALRKFYAKYVPQ